MSSYDCYRPMKREVYCLMWNYFEGRVVAYFKIYCSGIRFERWRKITKTVLWGVYVPVQGSNFSHEDRGSIFLRNFGTYLQVSARHYNPEDQHRMHRVRKWMWLYLICYFWYYRLKLKLSTLPRLPLHWYLRRNGMNHLHSFVFIYIWLRKYIQF